MLDARPAIPSGCDRLGFGRRPIGQL